MHLKTQITSILCYFLTGLIVYSYVLILCLSMMICVSIKFVVYSYIPICYIIKSVGYSYFAAVCHCMISTMCTTIWSTQMSATLTSKRVIVDLFSFSLRVCLKRYFSGIVANLCAFLTTQCNLIFDSTTKWKE